jgi:hypothetical protein
VASASLFVYLTHFAVYPHVMPVSSALAVLVSIGVGVAYWKAWRWLVTSAKRPLRRKTGLATPVMQRNGRFAGQEH